MTKRRYSRRAHFWIFLYIQLFGTPGNNDDTSDGVEYATMNKQRNHQ